MSYWLRYSAFRSPATAQPGVDGMPRDAGLIGPLRDGQGFSISRNQSVIGAVVGLVFLRRPAAIFLRVRAIAVNAVNGMARWRFAHILKEGSKAIQPTVAYLDASATVLLPADVIRVGASSNHILPRLSGPWLASAAQRVALGLRGLASLLHSHAAARLHVAALQVGGFHYYDIAAFTAAFPCGSSSIVAPGMANSSQAIESLPS